MFEKEELIKTLQDICENYSDIIGMVILFGSYSRNEATDSSDIDLYVEPRDTQDCLYSKITSPPLPARDIRTAMHKKNGAKNVLLFLAPNYRSFRYLLLQKVGKMVLQTEHGVQVETLMTLVLVRE